MGRQRAFLQVGQPSGGGVQMWPTAPPIPCPIPAMQPQPRHRFEQTHQPIWGLRWGKGTNTPLPRGFSSGLPT